METSNFAFLQALHPELAALAEQAEGSLWLNPRGTLVQGRLFGEILATTISTQEKVEPVYAIKQIDRLHKLAREGLLSEEIRNKFEWLRMNGNAAAHSSDEIHPDLALTAHRHMYELSVWYVELYGSVDMEVPPYQMPVLKQQVGPQAELPPVLDPGLVEKVISDQLEAKLLPNLDEKFRSIEEALLRIANTQAAATAEVTATESSVKHPVLEKAEADDRASSPENSKEIAAELNCRNLAVIDKRPFGGALWVVGGWELKETLGTWNDQGIYFRFAKNGSQSTKRKPAWFMLGKDPSAERWVAAPPPIEESSMIHQPAKDVDPPKPETAAKQENGDQLNTTDVPSMGEQSASSTVVLEIQKEVETEASAPPNDDVLVPEKLLNQPIRGYGSDRLAETSASLSVVTFGEWNEERLMQLYEQQPKLLHDVMVQLWFFGFQFEGKLGRFLKLQRENNDGYIGNIEIDKRLDEVLTPDVCRLLGRFGITSTHQLSGIPVSSLAWLLRGRHGETVERIRVYEESIEEKAPESKQTEDHKIIRLNGEQLLIPEELCTTQIADLNIQGCNALLRGIQNNWNIHVLGELPEVLSILPTRIKGVGATALTKFFEQLKGLLGPEAVSSRDYLERFDASRRSLSVFEAGEIVWNDTVCPVSHDEAAIQLDDSSFLGIQKLISEIHGAGIRTLGELPSELERLQVFQGVGATAIDKFYSQLVHMLSRYRVEREEAAQLNAMTPEERITYAIEQIEQNWQDWLQGQDTSRGSKRNLELLRFRWNFARDGRKVTLEETGQQFSLTRERVRQILVRQNEKLANDTQQLASLIRSACQPLNGFFYYPFHATESFFQYLIADTLDAQGLVYLEEYGWWSERSSSEIESVTQSLQKTLKQTFKGTVIIEPMLQGTMTNLAESFKFPLELLYLFTKSALLPCNQGFILSNSKKADLVEMVLKNYPSGVEVYKKADELIEEANRIWPDSFSKDREFTSIISRDEFADTAYLWGRGVYIHHSFVKPDLSLIEKTSLACEQLLEVRSPISIGRIYGQFEGSLQDAGVPNEYALYTLLRKYGSSSLQLRKFPHIWHESNGFQLNNSEMIKSYIREMNCPVQREDLIREFVESRGWKSFTVEYNLSTDPDFVRVDYGVVGLREFYYLDQTNVRELLDKLTTLLEGRPILHINLLFDEMKEYCKSLDVHAPSLLYDLLQEFADNDIKFIRFPFVIPAGQDIERVSMQALIEQYIADQSLEMPVSREQVMQWLTEELGAREESFDLILSSSKDIIYYARGQYGEYIHQDNLGWDDVKEQQLLDLVSMRLEEASRDGRPYLLAGQLLDAEYLPKLNMPLEWSEDLLIDLLKKSDKVQLLGSYDAIIVSLSDSAIRRESDFVAYVIERYFSGKARDRELYRKLAELRYSKDGQLLYETLKDIENGIGSIQKNEEHFLLKS
ncbi:sigma factor-like helix-turn-helix DNA-binding protein [Paenibacillus fonticola]|uniref:sigma factor-like helix-turn-helix DNA-binding protein n=1 Tax=Paenibacillus fonticola TaxID=379896 RepID=UPI00036609B2|nr:sigma factor-like helix-turn-helix DNA-binding protein [Paenibacillus fonticola]